MDKPCKTCPFLEVNRGKPTPTDFKCVEQNETDWYSQENIDGVWQVMRRSEISFLSCHSTDPDYYGKKNEHIHACVGATLAAYMHLRIFLDGGSSYASYVKIVGADQAMTLGSLGEKAVAIAGRRTSPDWGNMIVVGNIRVDLGDIRFPTGFKAAVEAFIELLKKEQENKSNQQTPINE